MRVNSMFELMAEFATHAMREAAAPLGVTGRSRGKGLGGGSFIGRRFSNRHWQREALRRRRALRSH